MNSCSSMIKSRIGDEKILLGKNHQIQVVAGLTFVQEFLETCGSLQTGANLQLRRFTIGSWPASFAECPQG